MHNLGILLSGRGSNFVAIADSIADGRIPGAGIAVVISNKADAPGIATARERGLNALVIPSKGKPREEHDREVVAALKQNNVDLVCLAGYMRLLSPWFVQQFPRKILNIHPSLLPAFPGLEAQEQAFAYGVKISGCTVHFVDEELDHGAIIVQKPVAVLDTDDERALAIRILEQEHIAYTEAINVVLAGNFETRGRRLLTARGIEHAEPRDVLTASFDSFWRDLTALARSPRYRFIDLEKHQVPESAGLYVLYQEAPLVTLYVGKASAKDKSSGQCTGLRFRIMENHLGKRGDDNFVRYVQKEFGLPTRSEACNYVRERCSVQWIETHDLLRLTSIEHFAIAALQPKLNRG